MAPCKRRETFLLESHTNPFLFSTESLQQQTTRKHSEQLGRRGEIKRKKTHRNKWKYTDIVKWSAHARASGLHFSTAMPPDAADDDMHGLQIFVVEKLEFVDKGNKMTKVRIQLPTYVQAHNIANVASVDVRVNAEQLLKHRFGLLHKVGRVLDVRIVRRK